MLLPLALAACSGEPEVPAPEGPDANLTEALPTPEPLPTATPEPLPTPSPTPTFEPAPAPEVEADQQMQDDAEATGMTARINRDDAPAEEPAPVPAEEQ
ncbi:hypothetical protein COC42_15155 [Sphingomonas spermidinifaciens]|uniref:Uncharacterized protein n=2 Tax=Sphingomonas spermidinifaciens TaxID=1141889 RepID=A0A2A4B4J9_9SPHN|nr:hypothetical protein COC42_15155 [Sphingomonas spermidinifaciens]